MTLSKESLNGTACLHCHHDWGQNCWVTAKSEKLPGIQLLLFRPIRHLRTSSSGAIKGQLVQTDSELAGWHAEYFGRFHSGHHSVSSRHIWRVCGELKVYSMPNLPKNAILRCTRGTSISIAGRGSWILTSAAPARRSDGSCSVSQYCQAHTSLRARQRNFLKTMA